MDNNSHHLVDNDLLESIKNFMDDLSNITFDKNFQDYHTIVKRIDKTKVKSYTKLIAGFINFFEVNTPVLECGNFDDLNEPCIFFKTDNGSFSLNIQQIFQNALDLEQNAIKDHLNHIWNLLNIMDQTPEEKYINKIFKDLKTKFSSDLTKEEQMVIIKDLFSDFQAQKLDISSVIKIACKKAREVLNQNGAADNSQTLSLISAVEEIDIDNFNMVEFISLIGKVSTIFVDGEGNPLNELFSSIFQGNQPHFDGVLNH